MAVLPIRAIAVVVPVRNEEALLRRCLQGIERARSSLDHRDGGAIPTVLVAVLDSCDDGSEPIAARSTAHVLSLQAGNVGIARAAGVRFALGLLPQIEPARIWIANTDADSEVPRDWLRQHLELADDGWDVVLGRVRPDLADLPEALRRTPVARAAVGGRPVYGANLGVRAASYLAVGGFAAAREHEDRRLVAALRRTGARVTASAAPPVLTSGRIAGRTPGGYAGFLRDALSRHRGRELAG